MAMGEYRTIALEHNGVMTRGTVVEEKDQWVVNLAIGIVKQAADDLRAAIRTHDDSTVQALQKWFLSEWGQLLSFGQGGAIIRRIKKEAEEYDTDET